jgi:hypothetical protein
MPIVHRRRDVVVRFVRSIVSRDRARQYDLGPSLTRADVRRAHGTGGRGPKVRWPTDARLVTM